MAVHRKRARSSRSRSVAGGSTYKRAMSSQSSVTVRATALAAVSSAGGDLGAAAEIIAARAREIAGGWSRQIPPAISVEVHGNTAEISCQAGPAYPNEIEGVRHPVFGNRKIPWVDNEFRPFLAPAADQASDKAMERYAQKLDPMLRRAGFN